MATTSEKVASAAAQAEAPAEVNFDFQGKDPKALLKEMVEAGVHLGHKTSSWNPKMKDYLWGQRNGVYILDLGKTITQVAKASQFLKKQAKIGKNILFVGTKKQAADVIKSEAERAGVYFINQRWLGGLITNFETIRQSLSKLRELESQKDSGFFKGLSKKEISRINRQINKLNKSLGGLKTMRGRPEVIFFVDQMKENIAVAEAKKAGMKVVGMVDSNSDPTNVDYVIPANDDSIRSIKLITKIFADAILEGKDKA